jgi:hypothetical protein
MPNDAVRVIDTANKIAVMAEGSLAGLERVMVDWPAEFRVILWEAVAHTATLRAEAARVGDAVGLPGSGS